MENLVKKELVRLSENSKYGTNRELWRENKEELLNCFEMQPEEVTADGLIICYFFTDNIPVGMDLYTVLTGKDIFREIDSLEEEYFDLDISGFTVSIEIDEDGELMYAAMALTLEDDGCFSDTLVTDVVYLEDIFIERIKEYYKAKADASLKYLENLIDGVIKDENVSEEDKEKFLRQLIDVAKDLEGGK